MQCPKCFSDMEVVEFNGVEIDRCTNCYGLWFDHLEQEILKKLEGAESIDIGDEFVGARLNEILDVPCPVCNIRMEQVLHTDPFEIKFESCPECQGIWFDAGEFRDYMEEEIYEQFKSVVDNLQTGDQGGG